MLDTKFIWRYIFSIGVVECMGKLRSVRKGRKKIHLFVSFGGKIGVGGIKYKKL